MIDFNQNPLITDQAGFFSCDLQDFNLWTAKHSAQASCTELTLLYTMRGLWFKSIIFKSCILWATYPPQIVYVVYERPPTQKSMLLTFDAWFDPGVLLKKWKNCIKKFEHFCWRAFSCCFDFFNLFSLKKSLRENSFVIANFKPLLTHTV